MTRKLKEVVVVTPCQLPDHDMPLVVGDRILEGLCEGVVRVNQELIRAKILSSQHLYHESWGMTYERDPRSLGTLLIDGQRKEAREYWATAYGAARRGADDCETLSSWLAAWYREVCLVNASCAIYPAITGPNGVVGRHVVVWVPCERPLYRIAPWGQNKFIRYEIPGKGYIEDPSVALGMYYKTADPPVRMPMRNPFLITNAALRLRASSLTVPYLPSHFINIPAGLKL